MMGDFIMYIRTSKTFTKWMQQKIKLDCIESIQLDEMDFTRYEIATGETASIFNPDCNQSTGLYNVIKIDYKWDCYALPRYLTTKELNRIFKTTSNKTAAGLIQALADALEI